MIRYSIFAFFKVSISIKLAAVQASGGAYMKIHETQCRFCEVSNDVSEYRTQMTEVRGQMDRRSSLNNCAAATTFVVVLLLVLSLVRYKILIQED